MAALTAVPSWRLPPDPRQETARHEAAHAAAHLFGWKVSGVALCARDWTAREYRMGVANVVSPESLDAVRLQQFAVMCLVAAAYTSQTDNGDRDDRGQTYDAVARIDPHGTRSLFEQTRREAERLVIDPTFRRIAGRVSEALLERGEISGRAFDQIAADVRRGVPA